MKVLKLIFIFSIITLLASCSKYTQNESGYFEANGGGDRYNEIEENPFVNVAEQAISTFSIDADGASYANARRYIEQDNALPPKNAIRTEEFINYFALDYPFTNASHPINLNGEVSACPWNSEHKLIRIGLKGKPLSKPDMPASNYVFLIDVSGSMSSDDKLGLLKNGFKMLVDELKSTDRVSIVTYAGSDQVLLKSAHGDEKQKIKNAIDKLGSGGSTAGAAGINTAYEIAQENFISEGNNRIIIGTDGDFNVGPSSQEELIALIEEKRENGIFLTVLGLGRGNLNEGMLEQIANKGNGTFEYLDKVEQLKKVFIYESEKLFTVAKDVKVQVEFNPELVSAYRLIGYENRVLSKEEFEKDDTDAGELGANQNITALYEIIPQVNAVTDFKPTFKIDFKYKLPQGNSSIPLALEVFDNNKSFESSSEFMKFSASVASFALLLRDSQYKGNTSFDSILSWLNMTNGLSDPHGFKAELKTLIEKSKKLK